VLYFLWLLVAFCLFCHLVWLLYLSLSSTAPYHLFLPSAVARPVYSARWVHAICPTSCALQMASFLLVGCLFVVSTHLIWIGFLACLFPRFVSLAFLFPFDLDLLVFPPFLLYVLHLLSFDAPLMGFGLACTILFCLSC
jgi:hypothetical protein